MATPWISPDTYPAPNGAAPQNAALDEAVSPSEATAHVLVIDDEPNIRLFLTETLARDGLQVHAAPSGKEGLEMLSNSDVPFELVFSDVMLPDMKGVDILKEIKRSQPDLPVIMITGYATKEAAVEAQRLGAFDYLAKPLPHVNDISLLAKRALERSRLIGENRYLRNQLIERHNFDNIVGENPLIQAAVVLASKVANQNATVLITGESGTGKEMLARHIHYRSNRADKPFVKVNCAALPEHLLEDELFGHEKGAFTDASAQRIGRFEWAHTGTLFLDEIGEISPNVQVKLLRVLQEREFERIGSSKTIKVDVRVIAATNKNLRKEIEEGRFREDLFYRLNVVPIELPPLRERRDDIERLVGHFVRKYGEETGRVITRVSDDAMQTIMESPWKGNIRELENCIERAVILAEDDTIDARHLLISPDGLNVQSAQVRATGGNLRRRAYERTTLEGFPTLRQAERSLIKRALELCEEDEGKAAHILDIDVSSLRSKLSDGLDIAPEAKPEPKSKEATAPSVSGSKTRRK
jgi:DNA-binding NtrC family response regulator